MRKHIAWYVRGMKGAAQFRERVNGMTDIERVMEALDAFANEAEGQ